MAAEPEVADRELVVGHIVGFRAWLLTESYRSALLRSYNGELWTPGQWMDAACEYGRKACVDTCPNEDCSCGIYAATDRTRLWSMGYARSGHIIGEVALIGKVIPGAWGWRAERARPLSLIVPYERWQLVKPLREAYRCEVVLGNPKELEG